MTEFKTPQELIDAYTNGFTGHILDQDGTDRLLASLPMPLFGDYAGALEGSGKGKLSLPFKCVQKFFPGFGPDERQTTGDCTSHGTRNAVDITRASEIVDKGEPEGFGARGATEGIYGHRGHSGQGMSGSRAAEFVSTVGGILLRKKYDTVDLSVYNSSTGAAWGGRGVPNALVQVAKQNPVETVSLIRSVNEARDSLFNGYGIAICSDYGFSSTRDKNGISRKSGSWNHCMSLIACDDTRTAVSEMLFLVQNSWGVFNSGGKMHDQPDGSFWVREEDIAGILAQNGSWVFSNVKGFPPRKISWTLNEVY